MLYGQRLSMDSGVAVGFFNRGREMLRRLGGAALVGVCLSSAVLVMSSCTEEVQIGPLEGRGYMFTFEDARALGYDVAWQSSVARTFFGNSRMVIPGDDYVLTSEDGKNVITAITSRDGDPVWRTPIGDPLERLMGMVRVGNDVVVSTQSDIYILDVATGRITSSQHFGRENISSTMPLIYGREAIYGSDDGRLVYHSLTAGIARGAYRLGAGIEMTPIWIGGSSVVVITRTGRIHMIDVATNSRHWEKGILDPVEATPAVSDSGLFVSGLDQSIWAFRLADGQQMWRRRFEYPLRDDPKIVDERLYQAVPNQGFAALDLRTGEIIWQNEAVKGGTVITRRDDDLIVWGKDAGSDSYGSTFYRIDAASGDIIAEVHSDWISFATASSMEEGDITNFPGVVHSSMINPADVNNLVND